MRLFVILLFAIRLSAAVDVLVQGALDAELQPLLAALSGKKETRLGPWTFWTGKIGGKTVVVSRTEVGPINASASTALAIDEFKPKVIINQGTAGGHSRAVKLWDIVVGAKTVDYSAYKSVHADEGAGVDPKRWSPVGHKMPIDGELRAFDAFPGDEELMKTALSVPYKRGRVMAGTVGSAFQYNRELDMIRWLHDAYGTDSEDMESAYAAGVAVAMKTRFLAIRIISDTEWEHPTFERIAGTYCAEFVVDVIRAMK
jgi:adenosylhomocysteine nucleosidase